MAIEILEGAALTSEQFDLTSKLAGLHSGFESTVTAVDGVFSGISEETFSNIAEWAGTKSEIVTATADDGIIDIIRQMYDGFNFEQGDTSLSLKEISNWKINENNPDQSISSHAGFTAEIISTAKENIKALLERTGTKTYRADDIPEEYRINDQLVDKVRVFADNTRETIQVKFVGKDAGECLRHLQSADYDKYFAEDGPDKIEIPKDFFDDVQKLAQEKIDKLQSEIEQMDLSDPENQATLEADNKILDRLKQIQDKIEQSNTTKEEAELAVTHPEQFTNIVFKKAALDTISQSNELGLKSGLASAGITFAVSTIDNYLKYTSGEISVKEACFDIVKDTGAAGGLGYGVVFISNSVSAAMSLSSHELIASLGKAGVPATILAVGMQSFDSLTDFAQGKIDASELAYELGESSSEIGGSMLGATVATGAVTVAGSAISGALSGTAVGSVFPGVGTAVGGLVGLGAGVVGSFVGSALASEAYATAVECGTEGAEILADKVQEVANAAIEKAKTELPEHLESVKSAINTFAGKNAIPIHV